jgi:hypothetical protein
MPNVGKDGSMSCLEPRERGMHRRVRESHRPRQPGLHLLVLWKHVGPALLPNLQAMLDFPQPPIRHVQSCRVFLIDVTVSN